MRVVLDNNILITFSISDNPPIKLIREAWLASKFELVICQELIAEYERVSAYKHLERYFIGNEREKRISDLYDFGSLIEISKPYPESPDPGDDYLFAMLAHPAVDLLVTGDKALLKEKSFDGKPIISAKDFVLDYLA